MDDHTTQPAANILRYHYNPLLSQNAPCCRRGSICDFFRLEEDPNLYLKKSAPFKNLAGAQGHSHFRQRTAVYRTTFSETYIFGERIWDIGGTATEYSHNSVAVET